MKRLAITILILVFSSFFTKGQTKLDSLFLCSGEVVAASITKITSDAIEYVYPGEVAVNVISTNDILRIKMGSGREIGYQQKSTPKSTFTNQAEVAYPDYYDLQIGENTIRLVLMKGGTFSMGYDGRNSRKFGSEPVHKVTVTPYYLSTSFIDRGLYSYLKNEDAKGDLTKPISVSWEEANRTVDLIAARTGSSFRLPLEAEWEFAAVSDRAEVLFPIREQDEHCQDYYAGYIGNLDNVSVDPIGPSFGNNHVVRRFYYGAWVYARAPWHGGKAYFRISIKAKDLFPEL